MDFNTITIEQEQKIKNTFRDWGVGINMSNFTNDGKSRWEDLISTSLFSTKDIRNKMLQIATRINSLCNDKLLGDNDVAFVVENDRDEKLNVTWLDIYTFLRCVYRYRIETEEYKRRKAEIEKLRSFIDSNKELKDKIKEAQANLKALEETL